MTRAYKSSDYPMLCKWLSRHEIADPDPTFFSDTGLVVDERAVGFLFTTNSKTCYIDHVVADPECPKEEKDKALNDLICALQDIARHRGFKMITVLARIQAMHKRFTSHGFNAFGVFTLYYKTFKKDNVCLG